MYRWYVINTYSGHENKVKHNLEHRVQTMSQNRNVRQVVVPTEQVSEMIRIACGNNKYAYVKNKNKSKGRVFHLANRWRCLSSQPVTQHEAKIIDQYRYGIDLELVLRHALEKTSPSTETTF